MSLYMSHALYKLPIGPMGNLIHIIEDTTTHQAAVVDPGWNAGLIHQFLSEHQLKLERILLTHSHYDHTNALNDLLALHSVPVHISAEEHEFYTRPIPSVVYITDGDTIPLGTMSIHVHFTPGHTPGSVCYQIGNDLIAGDTLFVYGCGTCSLPGGNAKQMFTTLNKLKHTLAADTIIHPGHGYSDSGTSVWKQELDGNPFLHIDNEADFVAYRLDIHDRTRTPPYGPLSPADVKQILQDNRCT
jgi:hydroxyacylglutathione hydrolase